MSYKYTGTEEQLIASQKLLNEQLKPLLEIKIKIIETSIPKFFINASKIETIYDKETQKKLDIINNEIYNIKETHKKELILKGLLEVSDV